MNRILEKTFYKIPFHVKLFFSIFTLALLFVIIVSTFQYQREKYFREQMMSATLNKYNTLVWFEMKIKGKSDTVFSNIGKIANLPGMRLTIMNENGRVFYDSQVHDVMHMTNHLHRPEIMDALHNGNGFSIRYSESVDKEMFYSAQKFDNVIIRTALPYDTATIALLEVDRKFIYFLVALFVVMVLTLLYYSTTLGKSISRLREFASRAEENTLNDNNIFFDSDDIGEISKKLIALYKRLASTTTALSIEQEKLIMHFQFSREGLAIFSHERQEILSNNLFIQQISLISDVQIDTPGKALELSEFKPIVDFLDESRNNQKEVNSTKMTVRKSGRAFEINCVVFEDKTFEISINNITAQDEETRLKRQLTQNISHELKTPVSSIQGYLETILSMPEMDEKKKQLFLERCFAQSKRLTYLLSDISLLNRMDESTTLFDIDQVDLSVIIKQIVSEVQLDFDKKNITVDIHDIPEKAIIEGNTSLIYSIFRNLLDNAGTYAGENVKVSINCFREDSNYFYFRLADTGVGVGEEHLNRLFERFYRVDKGRARKIGGTGLGLAIVKNAVMFHKGEISAKNRPDGGLEFIFSLKKKY